MFGKMQRFPLSIGITRATEIGQIIHSDVCCPMHVASLGGGIFFVLFTDDFSGWCSVFLLKQKSEVADQFKNYINLIHTDTGKAVKILRADNGGEFTGHSFLAWLSEKGIRFETSTPYTSEQNGVSERAKRTVVEGGRCILYAKHLPIELWAEAITYTVYRRNRVISKTSPVTPFQRWYETKPNISNLKIFGSAAIIHVPKIERKKLEPKSSKCYFIGYCLTQKAYIIWIPTTGKIKISRDVIFNEEFVNTENPMPRRDILNLLTNQTNFPVSTSTTDRESLNPSSPSLVVNPYADLHNQDAIQSDELEHSDKADPDELEVPEPEVPNQPEEETQNPSQPAEQVRHTPYPLRIRQPKIQWEESSLQSILQQHDNELDEPTSFPVR
jgi:hypothetical protein